MPKAETGNEYSREYRRKLGFTKQADAKDFFGAKDITPSIDLEYIGLLNNRLYEMVDKMNNVLNSGIKISTPSVFKKEFIDRPFSSMEKNNILPKLNNLGRRPEDVYFNWMRGYVVQSYFSRAIDAVFDTEVRKKVVIGDDDFTKLETFRKSPKADLEIELPSGEKLRLEIQAGFTGLNSVKIEDINGAKEYFEKTGIHTLIIHIDMIDFSVAFFNADEIDIDLYDDHWTIEGEYDRSLAYCLDSSYFFWNMMNSPIRESGISEIRAQL